MLIRRRLAKAGIHRGHARFDEPGAGEHDIDLHSVRSAATCHSHSAPQTDLIGAGGGADPIHVVWRRSCRRRTSRRRRRCG